MNVPETLRYTSDHEWVRLEDDKAWVGITDYAQDALGDVVFVQLPELGTTVASGDTFGEVESTKSVSDIYVPISGAVIEINDELVNAPQLLNEDPYGEGWICCIRFADETEIDALMDAQSYGRMIAS